MTTLFICVLQVYCRYRIVPDHDLSCVTLNSIDCALQMLQVQSLVKRRASRSFSRPLPLSSSQLPPTPLPIPPCVSTLRLPAAMHVVRFSPSVLVNQIIVLAKPGNMCTSQEWLTTKVHVLKIFKHKQ